MLVALMAGLAVASLASGQPVRPRPGVVPSGVPAAAQGAGPVVDPGVSGMATPPASQPILAEPERTTAIYGDWERRCVREAGQPVCEVVQTVSSSQGQPVVQFVVALGVLGVPARLTMLVPPSTTLTTPPRLLAAGPGVKGETVLELVWQRCIPEACIAECMLGDEAIARLRLGTGAYTLALQDGAGRNHVLPFSSRGLTQALDAAVHLGGLVGAPPKSAP